MTRIPFLRAEKYIVPADTAVQTMAFGHVATVESSDPDRPWLELTSDGSLRIREGFSWDGPSGPAVDTPRTMRASLAHDALYLLIRVGALPWSVRALADATYRALLLAHGVHPFRAWYHWAAVRLFGGLYLDPSRQLGALFRKAHP